MCFLVIHPEGDKTKVKVVHQTKLTIQMAAKLSIATRCVFNECPDAEAYAKDLASQNRLAYESFKGQA